MPDYNSDQEFLSRGMAAVLKLALLTTVTFTWACPLYCLSVPSTSILVNTVVQPYLGHFFGSSIAGYVQLGFLGFDLIFMAVVNYMTLSIVLYFVCVAIIYMGKSGLKVLLKPF